MYKLQWDEVITEIDVDTFWNVKLLEVDSGWMAASGVALQLLQLEALPRLGAPQDWIWRALGRSIHVKICVFFWWWGGPGDRAPSVEIDELQDVPPVAAASAAPAAPAAAAAATPGQSDPPGDVIKLTSRF